MRWPWNRIGDELRMELKDSREQYNNLTLAYKNYQRTTEHLLADYKNEINVLQQENRKLKEDINSSITEKNTWEIYQKSIDFSIDASEEVPTRSQTTSFNGAPTSYNKFDLMQMQLYDKWSRSADVVTDYRILFCEKIEKDLGINLEILKQTYNMAREYVKKQFYSPEIYNLLLNSFKPTVSPTIAYTSYPGIRTKPIPNV